MNYYQEIYLLPNAEVSIYFLWQKVYQQIHLAMVENKDVDNTSTVGVDFPEYNADKYCLGKKLRLFAQEKRTLEQMCCNKWLERLKDYVCISQINSIPQQVDGYAHVKLAKFKGNKENLSRRRAKRKGETLQQALAHFYSFEKQVSNLPYINMCSQTNGQHFRLFIEKQVVAESKVGSYSCYGLSGTSTVPIF